MRFYLVCVVSKQYLVFTAKPGKKGFGDIVELVIIHYSPKPSSIIQRFDTRLRTKDESIATYVGFIKAVVKVCEFGDPLEPMLRGRLVCGLNDDRIQRRL